jgi:hypothetical protein
MTGFGNDAQRQLAITLAGSAAPTAIGHQPLPMGPTGQNLAWPFSAGIWLCVAVRAW